MIKFKYGIPAIDLFFEVENPDWRLLKPKMDLMFIGLLLGITLALLTSEIISLSGMLPLYNFKFYKNIPLFLLVLILHEILHLLVFPNPLNATVGISFKKMIFFVTTKDTFSMKRLLFTTLLPTLVLTVVPLIYILFVQSHLFASIAILNLLGSGIDILFFYQLSSMPSNSLFRFSGDRLYVKLPAGLHPTPGTKE
jgi:hypothetical protein